MSSGELGIVVLVTTSSYTPGRWDLFGAIAARILPCCSILHCELPTFSMCALVYQDGVSNNLRMTSYMPNMMAALGTVRSR